MDGYALKPLEFGPGSLGPVVALLQTAFPDAGHFTGPVLQWQYVDNPAGPAVGSNAWAGAELAAHYVALPMEAMVDGKNERGLLSLNTATHPGHQGKGLFTRLANATFERAAHEGFGFVVGVANANSTHGFLKKLGFHLVSPLRAMIGAGPLPVPARAVSVQFEPVWDAASVAWRLAHPAYTYTGKRSPAGTLVVCQRKQFGAHYLLGVRNPEMIPDNLRPEQRRIWGKVWIGLDPAMDWAGHGYVNIPMRFRPAPLNLIFKDLTGAGRTLDPARVRFDAMAFDIL